MDIAITVLRIFPFNPVAALLVAIVFAIGTSRANPSTLRRHLLFFSSLTWAFYAPWELFMGSWRSSSGDMAIRVDLVLLIPLLLLAGSIGISTLIRGNNS